MPLVKANLKQAIESALSAGEEKSVSETADALAAAIDDYIKSMTITVAGVATAGSPAAQLQTAPVIATIT
ncbi:MAG: hypothetical protein H8E26_13125 [FCB group bacterium]|nr:hypothetical protein [FCB group bacterium]